MSWGLVRLPPDRFALVFSYTDPQAGPSAKGALVASATPTPEEAATAVKQPNMTVRVGPGLEVEPLSAHELARLALPAEPEWMRFFSGAPPTPWAADPYFKSRFHPAYPNDLQAHFFITSARKVEQMWVRLDAATTLPSTYEGTLLNTAHSDPSLKQGLRVKLRGAPGAPGPVWLSPVMEENLRAWDAKCTACSFDLVLEPVADVLKRNFPNAPPGAVMQAFTMRCAMCNQTMQVQLKPGGGGLTPAAASAPVRPAASGGGGRGNLILAAVVGGLFIVWFIVKRLM